MMERTAVANGQDEVIRKATADANAVQDAGNLIAVVVRLHHNLLPLKRACISGSELHKYPVCFAFNSKLNSLFPMTFIREMAALDAIKELERGESVEYTVMPL